MNIGTLVGISIDEISMNDGSRGNTILICNDTTNSDYESFYDLYEE